MEIDWTNKIVALMGAALSIVTYWAGKRKQKNDFLAELQASINLLSSENKKLIVEVVELRKENVMLMHSVNSLKTQNDVLQKEIEDLNTKLENVKTITRTK